MANIIVYCAGTVGQDTGHVGNTTFYMATCSQPWQQMAAPANTPLDPQEFAGFFFGVLVSTLSFYFVAVLPLGRFLRFIGQGLRDLL